LRTPRYLVVAVLGLAIFLCPPVEAQSVDTGVIRLGGSDRGEREEAAPPMTDAGWGGRRGFDYDSFEFRLESSWFLRKALLDDGRLDDAHRQSELIRSFCAEEGVRRLENPAGALVAEARRYSEEGSYEKALAALDLAETFDPGRPQIHFARSAVARQSGGGVVESIRELARGVRRSFAVAWTNWTLVNHLGIFAVVALLAAVAIFSLLMAFKYQASFRHEIEEWMTGLGAERWGQAVGWAILLLPLLTWFLAALTLVYWIVILFRFMRRGERTVAVAMLVAMVLAVPAFRASVALYGMTTDPAVRTTLESATGAYSPDRLVKLKELAETHPDDPVYTFLLAGLYKDGRYFEEAYHQYRRVLEIEPSNYQAEINIGNIYYRLGQYAEAIAAYRRAIDLQSDSVLAHYNMYLAQSESFRFKDAEESLRRAQKLNPELARSLLSRDSVTDQHSSVEDATIRIGSVWRAALEGRPLRATLESETTAGYWPALPQQFLNAISVLALLSLVACGVTVIAFGPRPARRCIRCGRPFCHRCRSDREGQEYCSQCLHLFVIGDGLAPETKTRKLYEVERYERSIRRGRKIFSLILPGASHLLRGTAGRGCFLIFLWVLALIAWKPGLLSPLERFAGLEFHLSVLRSGPVPAAYSMEPSALLALIAAVVVWLAGNAWIWRRREA
jgi:tetratricopeptide (TPR) repeat protein